MTFGHVLLSSAVTLGINMSELAVVLFGPKVTDQEARDLLGSLVTNALSVTKYPGLFDRLDILFQSTQGHWKSQWEDTQNYIRERTLVVDGLVLSFDGRKNVPVISVFDVQTFDSVKYSIYHGKPVVLQNIPMLPWPSLNDNVVKQGRMVRAYVEDIVENRHDLTGPISVTCLKLSKYPGQVVSVPLAMVQGLRGQESKAEGRRQALLAAHRAIGKG